MPGTTSYTGRHVVTEWGPGTIRTLTGRSVVIDLDGHKPGDAPIALARGTYGWDRFVTANQEVFS